MNPPCAKDQNTSGKDIFLQNKSEDCVLHLIIGEPISAPYFNLQKEAGPLQPQGWLYTFCQSHMHTHIFFVGRHRAVRCMHGLMEIKRRN
jgi:hypothetical protein